MSKPEWGTKRVCQSCAAKYYDLGRDPIMCPKCGTTFNPEALLKSRRPRPTAPKPAPVVAAKVAVVKDDDDDDDDDLAVVADDDDYDDLIEDTSDLGDDDDDGLSKVVVKDDDDDS